MEGVAEGEEAIMEASEAEREGVEEAISVGVSVESAAAPSLPGARRARARTS